MFEKVNLGAGDRRARGRRGWKVVSEEIFLSSCLLKYLLCTGDAMKTKSFLSCSSFKSVGSGAGECKCHGNKEAMGSSNEGQPPS